MLHRSVPRHANRHCLKSIQVTIYSLKSQGTSVVQGDFQPKGAPLAGNGASIRETENASQHSSQASATEFLHARPQSAPPQQEFSYSDRQRLTDDLPYYMSATSRDQERDGSGIINDRPSSINDWDDREEGQYTARQGPTNIAKGNLDSLSDVTRLDEAQAYSANTARRRSFNVRQDMESQQYSKARLSFLCFNLLVLRPRLSKVSAAISC